MNPKEAKALSLRPLTEAQAGAQGLRIFTPPKPKVEICKEKLIYLMYKRNIRVKVISRTFNISRGHIYRIIYTYKNK